MQLRLVQLANWVGLALLELVKAKHDFKRPALVVQRGITTRRTDDDCLLVLDRAGLNFAHLT